jgi:hypothetical protein
VVHGDQPVSLWLTAKEIRAGSLDLDRLSVLGAVDLPGSADKRYIPGFDAVAGFGRVIFPTAW